MKQNARKTTDNRLRWRCRRGLKELDVMLARFLDQEYPDLNEDERTVFSRLLEESDMELLGWFTGRSVPRDAAYSRLVALIRTDSASSG